MSTLGKVRIGYKAPEFHCDAVIKGTIEEVSLSTYINENKPSWLILLFIPAAFSFVCPTEVLAFQNCLDEFRDRNCDVVFVSVDTKHSLWHWQNVPRQYGGLGQIDIALLSDANHKMSRDYGVLIEEEGVCLRGMFILDEEAVVQQITLNNLTVGRSVLEALRLLEAFQAVAKHGVLCPVDWKPSNNAMETINTISNTLTESYDERLANLQKEFGDTVVVTDLDAKHKSEGEDKAKTNSRQSSSQSNSSTGGGGSAQYNGRARSQSHSTDNTPRFSSNDCLPRRSFSSARPAHSIHSKSAPQSLNTTPTPTPSSARPPTLRKEHSQPSTARHSRGHSSAPSAPAARPQAAQRTSSSQNHLLSLSKHNTYESSRGSHVILEFADPTSSPQAQASSANATPQSAYPHGHPSPNYTHSRSHSSAASSPTSSRSAGANAAGSGAAEKTRLQMTFEAIKKMSGGLSSPKNSGTGGEGSKEDGKTSGYFDVVVEESGGS